MTMEISMAAMARAIQQQTPDRSPATVLPEAASPLARLSALHEEATETAQLANLLGRSIYVAGALCAMTLLAIAASGIGEIAKAVVWAVLVLAAAGILALRYARTIKEPFQRPALKDFAQDLSAILLYAGFAWGAGAFLILPAASSVVAALLFAVGASGVVAAVLRERAAVFLFLAPVAALSSFASVLRFDGGALDAGLILIGCTGVMLGMSLAERKSLSLPLLAKIA
jgi:hypothetical protein